MTCVLHRSRRWHGAESCLRKALAFDMTAASAKGMAVAPGDYELQVGASSHDIRLTSRLSVRP